MRLVSVFVLQNGIEALSSCDIVIEAIIEETIELEEMHAAMMEEAVGVASLGKELKSLEGAHEACDRPTAAATSLYSGALTISHNKSCLTDLPCMRILWCAHPPLVCAWHVHGTYTHAHAH